MLRGILCICLLCLAVASARAEITVHLILSESGPAYLESANAFSAGLSPRQNIKIWPLADISAVQLQNLSRSSEQLLVPVGVKAANFVAEHHLGQAPVLTLMIPRSVSEKLQWPGNLPRKKISAVYIDQPAGRSLALLKATFPAARRVGLVISPENAAVAKSLALEAGRRNLQLNVETVTTADAVSSALRRVLADSDVLLLVPDGIAINAGNAQNVLLTTYRFRIPVVGFSQGLSKAGAVASVYSSPAQIGQQGAQFAQRLIETGEFPPPQHANENSISFNLHVARSLGLVLPNEADIRLKLEAQGE
jgi:putative ABC transport system substrate-binding protein